ncbi:DUF6074 family protein [Mesorhizobium sp. M0138]
MGKIRDVAAKMLAKSTDRHVESYRGQVTDGIHSSLSRAGIPESDQARQIGAFWHAVQAEIVRLTYRGQTGGAA